MLKIPGRLTGEELTSLGHEGLRVCAEDTSCGVFAEARNSADARATFIHIDGALVVGIDNQGADCRAEHL